MTTVRDGSDERPVEDWLARFVSSEAFALAFVWWAVLVSLAPLCLVCAAGFHSSGAIHIGLAFGLFGLVAGGFAVYRLVSIAGLMESTPSV